MGGERHSPGLKSLRHKEVDVGVVGSSPGTGG